MRDFDIPIVLFIFKRNKAVEIIKRIKEVKPKKIYLLGDQGRNEEEIKLVKECRRAVEEAIDWECEVIKNYAEKNRGVYENIGLGANWVFQKEKWAIFLEDDNLPEISFFDFCKEMLEKYQDDTRILWICGTNYLGKYESPFHESYVFTKHMLPCGWASWGDKFKKFYDGKLELCSNPEIIKKIKHSYYNWEVFFQYKLSWMNEYRRMKEGKRPISWDYQMDFSIKANNLFGICPCNNQIRNIGVDEFSIHGGSSYELIMTKRFCGMNSYPIKFPLTHPKTVLQDPIFEKKIARIILRPFTERIKMYISQIIRKILKVPYDKSIFQFLKEGK